MQEAKGMKFYHNQSSVNLGSDSWIQVTLGLTLKNYIIRFILFQYLGFFFEFYFSFSSDFFSLLLL